VEDNADGRRTFVFFGLGLFISRLPLTSEVSVLRRQGTPQLCCGDEGSKKRTLPRKGDTSQLAMRRFITYVIHNKSTFPHFYPQFTTSYSFYPTAHLLARRGRSQGTGASKRCYIKHNVRRKRKKPVEGLLTFLGITLFTRISFRLPLLFHDFENTHRTSRLSNFPLLSSHLQEKGNFDRSCKRFSFLFYARNNNSWAYDASFLFLRGTPFLRLLFLAKIGKRNRQRFAAPNLFC